ncbi:MAG: tetratricopeptide repeat protein [Cyanobacteria bacterium J06621_3]
MNLLKITSVGIILASLTIGCGQLNTFEEAVNKDTNTPTAAATEDQERSSSIFGNSGDADVEEGQRLIESGQFAESIPVLEGALEKNLNLYSESIVLTMIGNSYNELDQFDESLAYHARAIEADPENYKAYVNQGIVYRLIGEYDNAEASYKKALELEPNYAELHASMGALAIFQNKPEEAVEHLERSVELDDSLAVAHSNLALAYAAAGRFDEADASLQQAIVRGYQDADIIKERIDELRSVSN